MANKTCLSRRSMLGLAIAPIFVSETVSSGNVGEDDKLMALNGQLLETSAALNSESDHDEAIRLLDKIESIWAEMAKTPASTLRGLCVKARATSWGDEAEFGLLNPDTETSPNKRLSASLVRDLVRLDMAT
jgi:hypothetical protein